MLNPISSTESTMITNRDKNRKHFRSPHNFIAPVFCSFFSRRIVFFQRSRFVRWLSPKHYWSLATLLASGPISRGLAFEETQRGKFPLITGGRWSATYSHFAESTRHYSANRVCITSEHAMSRSLARVNYTAAELIRIMCAGRKLCSLFKLKKRAFI